MSDIELRELADWAHQGEIVGQALFGTMADLEGDPQRREWLRTLNELEVYVGEVLEPLVIDLGGDPAPRAESWERGERMARRSHSSGWTAFLGSFEAVTASALAKYRRILELVDARHRSAVETVIDHEEALREFARLAISGDDSPLSPVLRVLAGRPAG